MKKMLSILIALTMVLSLAAPMWAAPADPDTATVTGCAFHCTADGGNGKTYIDGQPKDFGKGAVVVLSRDADDPKVWHLVSINGDTGPFVCADCGSSDWVTFSNKSGVPNGKNIQLSDVAKTDDPEPPCDTYVFVPYFYYGTIVWDATKIDQNCPALQQVHGDHAAALTAAGYSIRAGIEIENPAGCIWDAQTSGYVLQSVYDANVAEYGAFWEYWGEQYQSVFEANCY